MYAVAVQGVFGVSSFVLRPLVSLLTFRDPMGAPQEQPGGPLASDLDYEVLKPVWDSILASVGGWKSFMETAPSVIRRAIDEVIDTPRSQRFTISELEKTEKTYIGTKIEILFRHFLGFPKGTILDLNIAGVETDIKNTIGGNWEFPPESLGHPCLVIKSHEKSGKCGVGLVLARLEYLTVSTNRDSKRRLTPAGKERIFWFLKDADYPKSFWTTLPLEVRKRITSRSSANETLAELCRLVQGVPISRNVVCDLARKKDGSAQRDPLKRLRHNGGARDILDREGITILWGDKLDDREMMRKFDLPQCDTDEFIAVMNCAIHANPVGQACELTRPSESQETLSL